VVFLLFSSISHLPLHLCNGPERLLLPGVGGWDERKLAGPRRHTLGTPALFTASPAVPSVALPAQAEDH